MAKKAKGNRVQVILECTEMKDSGLPGTSRYVTTKNRKNTPDRMELKKYNPILKKVTLHKEIKQYRIMAKKVVATLKTKDGRSYTKVIKMFKSPKTGAYAFEEKMVPAETAKDFFK
jgi:large subunit ribosomal protein L33